MPTSIRRSFGFVRAAHGLGIRCLWLVLAAVWLALLPSARALDDEITDYVTIPPGSYIVDMGVTPQTVANGLKPYGMVYDLVVNYRVAVEWSINPAKIKDGIDFTYNAKNYRGGTFIIRAENVTVAASNVIRSWKAQGVLVDGPIVSSIASVPVYDVVNSLAKLALDTDNGSIAEKYLIAAGIPASAYTFKLPGALDVCDDLFVLPHADPTWATHANLINFAQVGGYLWSACHAVSVLENIDDPGDADLAPNMNFLSATGLVLYGSHDDGSPPYTYVSSLDGGPIAQFMGILDSATQGGSEQIFLPKTGGWRPTTKVYVYDPTQADVPGLSPGEAAAVVHGRAFGNSSYGRVMYEGGHAHGGTAAPDVAAQRAFLNFYFLAGIDRRPDPVPNVPAIIVEQNPTNISMTVSGGSGSYSYSWSSSVGGTFSNPNSASTSFTPPDVTSNTTASITAIVTDSCGRVSFRTAFYTVQFIPTADLSVTATAAPVPAATSGSLTYTLAVVNSGPQTATNVVVTNTLAAGLTFVSAAGSGWSCSQSGGGVSCARAILATNVGSPSLISITAATPGTTGVVTNKAAVYSEIFDPSYANNTNSITTPVINGIDLALTKTAATNGYAGVVLPYTLTVTNHTPVGATNVVINDYLPVTLSYASASGVNWSSYYDAPTRRVTLLLPALAASGSSTVILNLLPGTNAAGLTVTNTATVSSATVDPVTGDNRATNAVSIAAAADLEISKSGEFDAAATPDAFIFTLELVNNGASVATSITVTDKLTYSTSPFPLFFSNAVATVGSYTPSGVRGSNGGSWIITSLAPGATATLTLYYGGSSSATFTNTAQILSVAEYDPVPGNNSATVLLDRDFTLIDMGILKTDSPDPVRTGSNLTYSITVTNNDTGQDWRGNAKTLTVIDILPPGTTYVSAAGTGWSIVYDVPTRTVTATYSTDINKKTATTFSLVVTAPIAPGSLTNTASMSYFHPQINDPNPANDSFSQVTTVSGNVDLQLIKSVDTSTPGLGSNVVFTVTIQNLTTNAADATNVRITETIPAGLTYLSASATLGLFDESAGYWYVGTLLGGATATLSLTVNAAQGGAITNFVAVSGLTQNDTNAANDSANSVVVVQACDLAVGKTVGNPIPNVGSNVTFTVSLTNFGPNTASNITVSDVLPAGLQYFSHSASSGSYNSGSGAWTITSLASNANTALTLTATVTQSGGLTNTAQALSSTPNDSNPANNTAGVGLVGQQMDLLVGKTVDNDHPLGVGSNLVFTIAVTNLGPSTASNVVLFDLLPASLGFVSSSPSQGGYVPGTGLWTVGTLTNSGFATLLLTATNRTLGQITNTARFSSAAQTESNTLNNSASVVIFSGGEADLYLTKSVDNDEPSQGSVVVFTLTLENYGPDPASGVIIRDVLPAGLRYLSNSAPAGTTYTTNTGDWTVGTLTNGQSLELTISVLVTGTGSIDNTASIFASNAADPDTIGNSATASLIAAAGADLIVLKSGVTNIFAGSNVTYTITLTNGGFSSATNAILTDTLPAGATFVSASGGGSHAAGVVTWPTLAIFTNTARTNVTVTITAPASGILTNFAAATSVTPDATPANNDGSAAASRVITTVGASADVATFKNGVTNVVAGSNLTYTISVTNLGPLTASDVVVIDVLPTNSIFVSASGGGSFSNGVVTWSSLTNFAASTGTNFTITITAPAGGSITNTASSTASTADPNLSNNNGSAAGAQVISTVSASADIATTKLGAVSTVAGSNLTYTITVTNLGPSSASNVVVSDILPTNSVFVSASGGGSFSNGVVTWSSLTNFAASTGTNFTITITAPAGGSITNTASSTASTADPDPSNNNGSAAGAKVISTVSASADIATFKSGATNVVAGSNLTYTITVTNLGPSTASNVVVSDILPTNSIFVSATGGGSFSNGVVTWSSFTNFTASTGTNFTVTITAPAGGSITNTASSTASTADPNLSNNNGSAAGGQVISTVTASADMATFKTGSTNVLAGSNLVYSISVTNLGPSSASNVVVSDILPTNSIFVSASGGGSFSNGVVTWSSLTNFAASTGTNFTITITAPAGGSITNTATSTASTSDPDLSNNNGSAAGAQVISTVSASADIATTKLGAVSTVAGSNLTYTITVTNLGPSSASNVVVSDILPTNSVFVSASGGGMFTNGAVTWSSLTTFAASSGTNFTVTITAPGSGPMTNSASSTSSTADPDGSNNDGTAAAAKVVTAITTLADVAASVAGPATIPAGSNILYTITVTNAGPSTASNVVVSDTLPAGVSFVSASSGGMYLAGVVTWPTMTNFIAGEITNFTVVATAPPSGTLTNTVASTSPTSDPDAANNNGTAIAATVITAISGTSVSGFVYLDANRNGFKDGSEAGTSLGLYAKLLPVTNPAGPALIVAAIDPGSGAYLLVNVPSGLYNIVLNNNAVLSDVTPNIPAGWSGTEMPAQVRTNVAVTAVSVTLQNFGLANALGFTGRVFKDTGGGSGVANDGVLNGSEAGLAGVTVKLTDNSGSTTYDTATTDGAGNYSLAVPNTLSNGVVLKVVEVNPASHISSGASVGNTGGTYARTNDTLTFTYAAGMAYSGVNFGDVPVSTLAPDSQQAGLPGTFVLHAHTFVAGSGGSVTFSVVSVPSPNIPGWSQVIYRDANCNAIIDPAETPISGALIVAAGDKICFVVKDFIPAGAPLNAQNQLTVTAAFGYTGASPVLAENLTRTDATTVGNPTTAGLTLLKAVDKAAALPGETITYTITYANNSDEPLASVILYDATPAFTTFLSATNGLLPTNFTGVTITAPASGGSGAVKWTFTGTLGPGRSGTVEYKVNVAQ